MNLRLRSDLCNSYKKETVYCWDICSFCTRFNVKQKDTSDYINKKLFVPIDFFPSSIREGILLMDKVYFFVHCHSAFANKKFILAFLIIMVFCIMNA